jgi:hypothetical protein
MSDNLPVKSEFLVYQTEDGRVKLDVRLDNETVWLTQIGRASCGKECRL